MLIAKGTAVHLYVGGRSIKPSGALLHDESGTAFPSKRCLITTFSKTKKPLRKTKWFGPDYTPFEGGISIPGTRSELAKTSNWDEIGEVDKIEYVRVGQHDGEYKHSFVDPKPILLRRGKVYCLVMRGATKCSWRGFVEKGQ